MQSPFPGMDPFLEAATWWPEFHSRLVVVLETQLRAGLVSDRYEVTRAQRCYMAAGAPGEQITEEHVAVRKRDGCELVTVLDLASPTARTTDAGRKACHDWRRTLAAAQANLVEIDLVLQGRPLMEYSRDKLPPWNYAVTVTCPLHPVRYEIYTATLDKRLPRFRVPLGEAAPAAILDLQSLFERCYAEGDYARRLDYRRDPAVSLTAETFRRIDRLLQAQGRRGPTPTHEQVAQRAYEIWEQEGRPHGRGPEHWLMALAELRAPSTVAQG